MYILKLFKRRRKRKQCVTCLKTFYKEPLEMIGVEGRLFDYELYSYTCPYCGSDNYIEV